MNPKLAQRIEREEKVERPQYNDIADKIEKLYLQQRSAFWTESELDFSDDVAIFDKLKDDEKYVLKCVFTYFAKGDRVVNDSVGRLAILYDTPPESKMFFNLQLMIEDIHTRTYENLISALIPKKEVDAVMNTTGYLNFIGSKIDWLKRYAKIDTPYVEMLFALACAEGIQFSSMFAIIFWFKKQGKLKNSVIKANEFIARDEGLHRDHACTLMQMQDGTLDENTALAILISCVAIEIEFINGTLNDTLELKKADLIQYVQYCADHLLEAMQFRRFYGSTNPFAFMNYIAIETKSNFFDTRNTAYKKSQKKYTGEDCVDF